MTTYPRVRFIDEGEELSRILIRRIITLSHGLGIDNGEKESQSYKDVFD